MNSTTKIAGAIGFLLVPTAWTYAETVLLKNGTTIKGAVVEMNETDATIDTADMGRIVIKRRAIQSMSDGAESPAPSTQSPPSNTPSSLAPAAALPMIVNNNNNNNNNAASSSAVATAKETTLSEAAVASIDRSELKNSKIASPMYGDHLSAQLGVGYSKLQLSISGTHRPEDVTDGPAFHIVPFKYKTTEGVAIALVGDGMFHSGTDAHAWSKMLHGGASLGWASEMPAAGTSGGAWSINGTFGYGSVTTKTKSDAPEPSYESIVLTSDTASFTDPASTNYDVKTFTGSLLGANIDYTYYSGDGLGFALGASALQGEVSNKTEAYSYVDTDYLDSGRRSVKAYIAYAGISKRF